MAEKIKLFCLPHAGGTAMVYADWRKYLHDAIQLCPVELAGRGRRFNENLYMSITDAAVDLFHSIKHQLTENKFALIGHSMGTILVYELIHIIKQMTGRQPIHAFFSGRYPPHLMKDEKILHRLPDDEFIKEVSKLGGIAKDVMENKELINLFIPILKADYRMLENYQCGPAIRKLDLDITILHGVNDQEVDRKDLDMWSMYTNKSIRIFEYRGDHFFLYENSEAVTTTINAILTKHCINKE